MSYDVLVPRWLVVLILLTMDYEKHSAGGFNLTSAKLGCNRRVLCAKPITLVTSGDKANWLAGKVCCAFKYRNQCSLELSGWVNRAQRVLPKISYYRRMCRLAGDQPDWLQINKKSKWVSDQISRNSNQHNQWNILFLPNQTVPPSASPTPDRKSVV